VHPALEQTRDLLAAELAGRTAEQVSRHPAGDAARWNAQQVIEHLSATWRLTTDGLEDRLRKGRPLQTHATWKQRWAQWMVCNLGYFPPRRQAPGATRPPAELGTAVDGDALVARIGAELETMDGGLTRMEPVAAGGAALTHMVLGPLTVAQWRRFHRVHARHHAKQIHAALADGAAGT